MAQNPGAPIQGVRNSQTNVTDFFDNLNAGVFKEKLGVILSEAALGTMLHGIGAKKGKITIDISFQQLGDNNQVVVTHKIAKSVPTKRGKKMEEDITDTAFYVGHGGVLTIEPPKEEADGQFSLKQV